MASGALKKETEMREEPEMIAFGVFAVRSRSNDRLTGTTSARNKKDLQLRTSASLQPVVSLLFFWLLNLEADEMGERIGWECGPNPRSNSIQSYLFTYASVLLQDLHLLLFG